MGCFNFDKFQSMHLAWPVLFITLTTVICHKSNKEREAIFDRNMRGKMYNVADTGIIMGLGKRLFQNSFLDTST